MYNALKTVSQNQRYKAVYLKYILKLETNSSRSAKFSTFIDITSSYKYKLSLLHKFTFLNMQVRDFTI